MVVEAVCVCRGDLCLQRRPVFAMQSLFLYWDEVPGTSISSVTFAECWTESYKKMLGCGQTERGSELHRENVATVSEFSFSSIICADFFKSVLFERGCISCPTQLLLSCTFVSTPPALC